MDERTGPPTTSASSATGVQIPAERDTFVPHYHLGLAVKGLEARTTLPATSNADLVAWAAKLSPSPRQPIYADLSGVIYRNAGSGWAPTGDGGANTKAITALQARATALEARVAQAEQKKILAYQTPTFAVRTLGSSPTRIPEYRASVPVIAGHLYRVTMRAMTYSGSAAGVSIFSIRAGSTLLVEDTQAANSSPSTVSTGHTQTVIGVWRAESSGSQDFDLYAWAAVGGQVRFNATASNTLVMVEDLGVAP